MAEKEPKKTTASTKTVEKKFCTKCGKELKKGEKCNCTEEVANYTEASYFKSTIDVINNEYKNPSTTLKKELNRKDNTISTILLFALAIACGIYLIAMVSSSLKAASSATFGLTSYVSNNISYFKVFIYGVLFSLLASGIPICSAYLVGRIAKSADLSLKKSFRLYVTCNAPLIYAYLVMAVIVILNISILNIIGYIAMAIIGVYCFINFILAFLEESTTNENRKSWLVTSMIVIWVTIEVIVLIFMLGSIGLDFYNQIDTSKNNVNDMFKW